MLYTREEIEASRLTTLIDEIVEQLSGHDAASDEYAKMADQLTKLYKLLQIETELKLKTNESDMKDRELDSKIRINERELDAKREEMRATMRLKEHENEIKELETNAKIRQVDVEVMSKEDEIDRRRKISPDTLALIGANLAGIVVIIGYERMNVITSKALSFVSKLR